VTSQEFIERISIFTVSDRHRHQHLLMTVISFIVGLSISGQTFTPSFWKILKSLAL
jgi:hypothetical protein